MGDARAELDLARSIRPGLDILANEIVIALKKRTRFLTNPRVYAPGLVLINRRVSLLEHTLGRVERAHAELGRFTFADQEAFTDVSTVTPVIDRDPPPSPILHVPSGAGRRVLAFYRGWVKSACEEGEDPGSFGETVTADVAAVLAVMERVNLGKFVAESKYAQSPAAFAATGGEREALHALIRHPDREAQVLDLARRLAEHYALAPELAVCVFEFMIDLTVDVEVDYLRARIRRDA